MKNVRVFALNPLCEGVDDAAGNVQPKLVSASGKRRTPLILCELRRFLSRRNTAAIAVVAYGRPAFGTTEGANDRSTPRTQTYMALLASIKERIQGAQVRAALAVNRELILLYWGIGSEITRRQKEEGWGTKSLTLWPGTCQQL